MVVSVGGGGGNGRGERNPIPDRQVLSGQPPQVSCFLLRQLFWTGCLCQPAFRQLDTNLPKKQQLTAEQLFGKEEARVGWIISAPPLY